MMIRSPGLAASIALWMLADAATWVGALPPTVTVTVSMDCLPLAAVMTNWPHCVEVVPVGLYCACCCMRAIRHAAVGTVPVIVVSLQLTPVRGRGHAIAADQGYRSRGAPKP